MENNIAFRYGTNDSRIQRLFSAMKTKILFAIVLASALFSTGFAQSPDKAKLDQFFRSPHRKK